jgi:hypothetical protein
MGSSAEQSRRDGKVNATVSLPEYRIRTQREAALYYAISRSRTTLRTKAPRHRARAIELSKTRTRILSRFLAVILAAATLVGGYVVLVSRVQIDVGDVTDLSFWQIPIHVVNDGYWTLYQVRFLCHIDTVTVVGHPKIHFINLEGGNLLHPISRLVELDSFDASCPLKIAGANTRISALDIIVGSQTLLPIRQSITCARFVQSDVSAQHFRWRRMPQDFARCR